MALYHSQMQRHMIILFTQSRVEHFLFVCFVALRLKLTPMVMAGRSVYLTTLFPGQA